MRLLARVKQIGERRGELSERVRRAGLDEDDCSALLFLLRVAGGLARLLERKAVAVERLRRCFVKRTESSAKILREIDREAAAEETGPAPHGAPDGNVTAIPPEPKKRKGHGRIGAKGYPNAETVRVPHERHKAGDPCPKCPGGRLYWHPAGRFLKLIGQAALRAKVYLQEKLRCNACGAIVSAILPPGVADEGTATPEACAMVALLRYGAGFPHFRLSRLQGLLGVPIAASTLWEMTLAQYRSVRAVVAVLTHLGAQGEVIHHDDTTGKVIEVMKEIEKEKDEAERRGEKPTRNERDEHNKIYTTGLLSKVDGHQIMLYVTSRRHAGNNLDALLRARDPSRGPPIQAGDMLSSNNVEAETLRSGCMGHNRRGFIDCYTAFREPVRYVILELKKVYRCEAESKARKMTPEERLWHHQERSLPVMDGLKAWGERQMDEKLVEPNSPLGQAIRYMLRHWEALTLFLKVPGAPLTNDELERLFKMAQNHNKNSLFYLTRHGARVGDAMMSLIQTASLNGENPFEYLTALGRHEARVLAAPEKWLPWNWRENLTAAAKIRPA